MSCVQVLHSSFTAELCSAESMPLARNPIVTVDLREIPKKKKKRIAACAARHSNKLRKSEQCALCSLWLMFSASPDANTSAEAATPQQKGCCVRSSLHKYLPLPFAEEAP
jgi:hypothetical protein